MYYCIVSKLKLLASWQPYQRLKFTCSIYKWGKKKILSSWITMSSRSVWDNVSDKKATKTELPVMTPCCALTLQDTLIFQHHFTLIIELITYTNKSSLTDTGPSQLYLYHLYVVQHELHENLFFHITIQKKSHNLLSKSSSETIKKNWLIYWYFI